MEIIITIEELFVVWGSFTEENKKGSTGSIYQPFSDPQFLIIALLIQVKTWFQNRRMKHKKQLRKAQDERKTNGELEGSAENSSESDLNEKSAEDQSGLDAFLLEENEDDVDIEDDICSSDHLL